MRWALWEIAKTNAVGLFAFSSSRSRSCFQWGSSLGCVFRAKTTMSSARKSVGTAQTFRVVRTGNVDIAVKKETSGIFSADQQLCVR